MPNHFYGSFHWELRPIDDRRILLDALRVFCREGTNLYVESVSPSLVQRLRFWRMRSSYKTHLIPDILSPPPSTFHIKLTEPHLDKLKRMVDRDGLDERSIAHIKGYSGNQGLFWFHGFCDEGDDSLSLSRHVSESTIQELESILGIKVQKKFGELKTEREQKEDLDRTLTAMENYRDLENP